MSSTVKLPVRKSKYGTRYLSDPMGRDRVKIKESLCLTISVELTFIGAWYTVTEELFMKSTTVSYHWKVTIYGRESGRSVW